MTFEASFFGPGNRLRWDAIEAGSLSDDIKERLGPFLEDLRRNPDVLVLPRVRDDGTVQWYVLCSSPRAARIARDEVRAFLGPTYSDFDGRPTVLDPLDPVDAAVLGRYGASAIRIEVPAADLMRVARERLRLLTRLRDERPTRVARRIRATGRVLRDFEYALLAGDGATASECISELRSTGQLGAANLLFLQVRRLAAGGLWNAILTLPEMESLLAMVRPRRVTEALIRTVYVTRLQEFEEGARAPDALARFRSEILPRFRDLYRSRAGLSGHEVDASFLLAAAASVPPRTEMAEGILGNYAPDSPSRAYLGSLLQLIPETESRVQASRLDEARDAFATADVDRAYQIALALPPTFDRCALLLRCARDMGTLASAQVALAAAYDLPEPDRARLDGHVVLARIREGMASLATGRRASPSSHLVEELPSSWSTWLRRLAGAEPWRDAVAVAAVAAREWKLEPLLTDHAAVQEIADLFLGDRPQWGQAALRDSLPYLLEFFIERGPDSRLRAIFESLFLTIAVDDQVSLPQIGALLRAAEARLYLGLSPAEYREVVRQLLSAIEAVESPSIADPALETLEVLISTACPDPAERQDFLARIATLFQRWYRRIDPAQWALLKELGDELGVEVAIHARPQEDGTPEARSIWEALDGQKIAMYSLREPALRRAGAVVSELCPGARVETFHDHVGGAPALRAAASAADVFVLATAAAKHAATIFIEANRPKSRVTLYARGQGSASLLDAIRQHLVRPTVGRD